MVEPVFTGMRTQAESALDRLDALVAEHRPFGDRDYLEEQVCARYIGRLEKLGARLPAAREFTRALESVEPHAQYRILGDPVLRYGVQQGLRRVLANASDALPLGECEDLFRECARRLEEGRASLAPRSGGHDAHRLGGDASQAWIWSEDHPDDIFGRVFRKLMRDVFGPEPLHSPSAEDRARLAAGAELLGALLPWSARSALGHAHVIVLAPNVGGWRQKGSCSDFKAIGVVALNREMLQNPWWVAEHLLHESLHQKLYDFRHTHSLLARDLSPQASALPEARIVYSIWNVATAPKSNWWDVFRAIAALHVYVHIALLRLRVEERQAELAPRFGAPDALRPAMTSRREAVERSHYLGRQLARACWHELGPAGRLFVEWLLSVLNTLDPSPPPADSVYLRLLVNRYLTEATIMAHKAASADLAARTEATVKNETTTVLSVLEALDAKGADFESLHEAAARRTDETVQDAFLRFRSTVAALLLSLSPDGYGLGRPLSGASSALDAKVDAMIERSSHQLAPILEASARRAPELSVPAP
jgi:hypothetical protein